MSLSIGIVGLPNVGKSTLFTALTRKGGLAGGLCAVFVPSAGTFALGQPGPDGHYSTPIAAEVDHATAAADSAEIVDIAVVAADGRVLLDTLVRAERPIPAGASATRLSPTRWSRSLRPAIWTAALTRPRRSSTG